MYCKFFCAFSLFLLMYLTRTAGIETRCLSSRFRIPQMYLTRTAGIETSVTEIVQTRLIKCILPALRELKPGAFWRSRCARRMYLTRTAGIETRCLSSRFRIPQMYLTRTAGIETSVTEIVQTRLIKCILPALRELKPGAFWRSRCARRMYLTRTAGIETGRKENSTFWVLPMYLTRTAGIETL